MQTLIIFWSSWRLEMLVSERQQAAHLTCRCSPLKNISSPKASHMSFEALLFTLALSNVMVNSWPTNSHSIKPEVMPSYTAYDVCGKEICLNAMIFFWSSNSSMMKWAVTPRYPKFYLEDQRSTVKLTWDFNFENCSVNISFSSSYNRRQSARTLYRPTTLKYGWQ
jgi:hypothetical protein